MHATAPPPTELSSGEKRPAIQRRIPRLLGSPNVPTSPSAMQPLASVRQPLLSFMAYWWPSSLARVSRFAHGSRHMASSTIGVKGEDLDNKTGMRSLKPPANIAGCEKGGSRNANSGDEDACRTTLEGIDIKLDTDAARETVGKTGCQLRGNGIDKECRDAEEPDHFWDDVRPMDILPYSSHCDGSIYNGFDNDCWKRVFRIDNRNETRLEAMRFSHPTDCFIRDGICMRHLTSHMLQIFSLRLARIPVGHGSVELYGYIAVRDGLDPLLNYFVNITRDDPIIVKQGSLIKMSGPKRGAVLVDTTLIEYDMKVKTGKQESEDLQLIDGVSAVDTVDAPNCRPFTERIHGDCGAIDLTVASLCRAVEATVEVAILQVQGNFRMRLSCFTSGIHEEIRLFDGAIGELSGVKRFVVAVVEDSEIDLRFKVAKDSCLCCCSFKANIHGHVNREINTSRALFAVKVTWSTLR